MYNRAVMIAMLVSVIYESHPVLLFGQCQTIAGHTWTEDDGASGTRTYSLSQDSAGTISGNTYKASCVSPFWGVTGSFRSDGSFTITAVNPSPGDPVCTSGSFTVTGTVATPGCDTMSGTWTNDSGDSGLVDWTKACDVPTSETTNDDGWADSAGYPTLYNFMQVLSGSVNFGGRTVNETFPSQGEDTCYMPGSPFGPYYSPPSWASWPVGFIDSAPSATNTYGHDQVGWLPDAITYYRANRPPQGLPFPCGGQWQQQMNISCSTATNFYQANYMAASMDATSISSNRSSGFGYRIWP
jgi:hypothetical protein